MTPSSILLGALASAAHLVHVAHAQQQFGKDIYWNGPYFFLGCEPDQGAAMKALFKQVGISLSNSIIPDAELGAASPYGFKTWFSTNSATIVSDIYQDMNEAASESSVNDRAVNRPKIVWVNYNNPLLQPASAACQRKNYIGVTKSDTEYIMLCPRFWDSDHGDYPSNSDCPQVNGAETGFTSGNSAFAGQLKINYNKQSTIIHELVHKYSPSPSSNEVYGINQCTQLSAADQLNNPNNYAFHSATVVAKCTQFPEGNGGLRRSRHRRQTAATNDSSDAIDLTVDDGESTWYDDDATFGADFDSALASATVMLQGLGTSVQASPGATA